MASTRQPKPKKGVPEPARRPQAWTGTRASTTFSPSGTPRPQANAPPTAQVAFPPLGQTNGARPDTSRDRNLQSLSGLTGTTITLITKTAQRYEGVVLSTNGEGDTTGVTLKDVKDLSNLGAPLKDQFFVASTNIELWSSGPADVKFTNGDSFQTDTDISHTQNAVRERELKAWVPGADAPPVPLVGTDDDTFGSGASNTTWDQFAVNEKKFGVKTSFDENLYTTKLNRDAADFKERERKAQKLANEILGTTTNNPHIAEERGQVVDDSGNNEEEKYGAVVRGTNAYVPPGARRTSALSPPNNSVTMPKLDVPKVSVNGPDGSTVVPQAQSPPSSKTSSPAPATTASTNKPPADPLPAFRDFVTNEKQRLTQKRQALVKSEMDKRMAELVKFSQSFKLNKPIPDDLVPILAKDEDKQRAIREKATKDSTSTQARAIGPSTAATASRGIVAGGIKNSVAQPLGSSTAVKAVKTVTVAQPPSTAAASKGAVVNKTTPILEASSKKVTMFIQPIPPFKGGKSRASSNGNLSSATVNGSGTSMAAPSGSAPSITTPTSPITAANRLNVNASSFRPNPKASAFTPGAVSPITTTPTASASVSPKPKTEPIPSAPNPFFGSRPIKKSPPVHIKDDFNPFKSGKVTDPVQVPALWPYNGKRYIQMFPMPQHPPQQHPSHMMPPGPPPIPPPSYEEDAAARGYVYAYPPYGYTGQHMMPGMAPPGPPGAYMPGPFMQPMPYPPGMPPPNAMYSPAMGQMPPPQPYMQPPPGAYPPPPNGAGPRPSMPPTPIPAHAHPYYHQSPQLQHAVPYQMMMPPPNVAPHGYDPNPASVQMGGHA